MEGVGIGLFGTLFIIVLLGGSMYGCPQYNVYQQKLDGEAQLAKAESTRRTRVLEAQAEKDSASLKAEAEVIRADGVARANKIIADSLGGAEGYLRWRYIEMLQETGVGDKGREVIYVPTEAGLPVLEANRLRQK